MSTDHLARPTIVACLGLVILGAVIRGVLLHSALGPADTDESVVLLMARDILHGHFETFFWGQEYGGSQEAFLVALVAGIGIPLRFAGETVTICLSAAAAALLWRTAKASVGANAALLAGALYWSAPIVYVFLSQKERGFYGSSAVSCLAALFFATRYLGRGRVVDVLGLGLAVGNAIWSSPQAFYLLVPLGLWLVGHVVLGKHWDVLRALPYGALAAVVGGAPWLWTNAHTGLASLRPPITPVSTPTERLSLYARLALPQVTGFKLPYNPSAWIGTRAFIVPHIGVVLFALLAAFLLARKVPWVPLAIAWNPIMFTALSTSFYVSEARYLFLLWPPAALALAYGAFRFGKVPGGAALAVLFGVLSAVGCSMLVSLGADRPGSFDLQVPKAEKVVAAMNQLGVRYAFAEYWSSYPLEVASDGEVVATPLYTIRDPRREQWVRSADRVAYVLFSNGCAEKALSVVAERDGQRPPVRLATGSPFVVIVPEKPIMPEAVVRLWAEVRSRALTDQADCSD